MVLEHLFPENWLEQKIRYAFILAFIYSAVSIVLARFLFAGNSGIVAVVFTSILLLPYLKKLFAKEESLELKEKSGSHLLQFFKDTIPAIKVYCALFFGIYISFMLYSFILPLIGFDTGVVFKEQLAIEAGLKGHAFSTGLFWNIFMNNWWVLLACFGLALLTGDGAIFFIVWNASTWGAIFGFRALAAGEIGNPLINLLLIFLITLPHILLESGAYILAAIAGGVISTNVVSKSAEITAFMVYLLGCLIGYFLYLVLIIAVIPAGITRGLLQIGGIGIILWVLSFSLNETRHRRVYLNNCYLFFIAVALFFIGAGVETYVLGNSTALGSIYSAALS